MKNLLSLFMSLLISSTLLAQHPVMITPNIQHGGDKNDYTLLFLFDNDGGVSGINSVPSYQCNKSIIPSVVIENFGTNNLTTATLEYYIDGGDAAYLDWEGSLPPFFTDTIEFPTIDVDPGTHTLTIQITKANGQLDINGLNNNSIQFNIVGESAPAPYAEHFDAPQMPDGYFVQKYDGGSSWVVTDVTGTMNSIGCLFMPFYVNDANNDEDDLYVKNVDLTNQAESVLRFDLAYAYYSDFYYDELKVSASADCGDHWDMLYDKSKDDLATAPFTDLPFVPNSSQWRTESVDLNSYSGHDDVMVRFEAINGHGNNLYIDNITMDQNTGIGNISDATELSAYPNPANDVVAISLPSGLKSKGDLLMFNEVGEKILEMNNVSGPMFTFSCKDFPNGSYLIVLNQQSSAPTISRLIVSH